MFMLKEQRVYFEESDWISLKDFYDRSHWSMDSKTWNIVHKSHVCLHNYGSIQIAIWLSSLHKMLDKN